MSPPPRCKCCHDTRITALGSLDFNKTCLDERLGHRLFPVSPLAIPYYACQGCGFIFTPYMDSWTAENFKDQIYNAEYILADPPIPGRENAPLREGSSYHTGLHLARLLAGSQKEISILDYGSGGNPGRTALALLDQGFDCHSYDPYRGDADRLNRTRFDFIIALEVIEHCHDLDDLGRFMAGHLSRDGLLWISTFLHPFPTPSNVLNSWYIAPRNGHISIFTFQALTALFRRYKISIVQTVHGGLIGMKQVPEFPNAFFA